MYVYLVQNKLNSDKGWGGTHGCLKEKTSLIGTLHSACPARPQGALLGRLSSRGSWRRMDGWIDG